MTEPDKCTKCGSPLPSGVRGGLCPACLLKCGLETNTAGFTEDPASQGFAAESDQARARWTPPPVEQLAPLFPELDILKLIGRGGMGTVYQAREKQLDRLVALKILPPEIGREDSLAKSFAQRFAREAQAMAKLSHPNIVTIHSFGQRGELYFFLMEYVDGLNLRQLLDAGTVSPKEALAIVPQICDALQYAHDRGIVHRDIKPENILLNQQGQVKIADFGLAKLVGRDVGVPPSQERQDREQDARATQSVMGTPQYMAPEQIEQPGEVDHRADIYSLGVVFYQMLTGELPKGGFDKKFEPPSRKVFIDVRLDEVVLRALEREPARRYQQVSEVKTQVETIVASSTGVSPVGEAARHGQDAHATRQNARQAVKAPAVGMIVAAGINLAVLFAVIAVLATLSNRGAADAGDSRIFISWWPVLFILLPGLIINCSILWGAMRMMQLRNRGFSIAAAILALIATPGNIIGLPMGIWALVVLSRREVIDAFRKAQGGKRARSRLWWGVVAAIALVAAVVIALGWFVYFEEHRATPLCSVEGLVTDAATGKPIIGARVSDHVYGGGPSRPIKETWTDSDGHYVLRTWFEEHTLSASAPGYEPQLKPFSGREPTVNFNFELQRTAPAATRP